MSQIRDSYVARQPVLDGRQRTIGYELLFRDCLEATKAEFDNAVKATAEVIVSCFASMSEDTVLSDTLGFVKVSHWFLHSDLASALPAANTVLCIPPDCPVDDKTIKRCRQLKKRGIRMCLDNLQRRDNRAPLFDTIDFARIDTRGLKKAEVRQVLRTVAKTKVKLIADKVESPESFEEIAGLGFDYFQGYYFARPAVKVQRRVEPEQAILIKLLLKLQKEVELEEIEEVFKAQVSLGTTLLRLANSGGHVGVRIESINQALVMMGRRGLERWITLLMFAGSDGKQAGNPLLELAAQRGKCVELMTLRLVADDVDEEEARQAGDRAFLVGMTSLLDVLMGMDYEKVFQQIPLQEDLQRAVRNGEGQLGKLLSLQKLLEKAAFAELECELDALGVTPAEFDEVQRESVSWALQQSKQVGL